MREHVAIVGSRDYPNLAAVRAYVEALPIETVIVSGHGGKVDLLAEEIADNRGMAKIIHPAKWRENGKYNPGAGFERNSLIVRDCDRAVAFWDGKSNGTRDTISKMDGVGKPYEIHLPGSSGQPLLSQPRLW
jgi:hypothetical protein